MGCGETGYPGTSRPGARALKVLDRQLLGSSVPFEGTPLQCCSVVTVGILRHFFAVGARSVGIAAGKPVTTLEEVGHGKAPGRDYGLRLAAGLAAHESPAIVAFRDTHARVSVSMPLTVIRQRASHEPPGARLPGAPGSLQHLIHRLHGAVPLDPERVNLPGVYLQGGG
jgi:hypothetical protein